MSLLCRLFLLVLTLGAANCHADRDIVYSARYYSPPGSHRTSHFHLYRINPDGTGRTQITFGRFDEGQPLWSPDGRWILYDRYSGDAPTDALYLVRASSGRPTRLLSPLSRLDFRESVWSPDGRTLALFSPLRQSLLLMNCKTQAIRRIRDVTDIVWSPDGRRAYIVVGDSFSKAGSRAEILTVRTGACVPIPDFDSTTWTVGHSAVWQGGNDLIGVSRRSKPGRLTLAMSDLAGHIVRTVACHWPPGKHDPGAGSTDLGAAALLPGPAGRRWDLWVEDNSISSWQDLLYSCVEMKTGNLSLFAEGQLMSFSPDGKFFCLSPHRQTVHYGVWRDGTERQVWATPLQVGSVASKHVKTITPGVVWVNGADWRKAKP